jgi:hypothetical protein
MTVRRRDDGTITLEGACGVEDAEPLLQMLIATPDGPIDWSACERLHAAVAQVVLAAGVRPVGPCGDPWIGRWLAPADPAEVASGAGN